MHSGVYYWEILLEPRNNPEIKVKIGVTSKQDYKKDRYCFADYESGFAFYGLG